MPLPERFHRLLTVLFDERVFSIYLERESGMTPSVLQLLVFAFNEGPSRVRMFLESGELKQVVERV